MIAYLVMFVDVSSFPPTVAGCGIYSEPTPTTAGRIFPFRLMELGGAELSYGEAEERLLRFLAGLPTWDPLAKLISAAGSGDRSPLGKLTYRQDPIGELCALVARTRELQSKMSPDELVAADFAIEQLGEPAPKKELPHLPAVWVICPECVGAIGEGMERCASCRGAGVVVNKSVAQ